MPFPGYAPKYRAVETAMKARYPQIACTGAATRDTSGAFEVEIDGTVVHSKLEGQGHVDTAEKLERILEAIERASD